MPQDGEPESPDSPPADHIAVGRVLSPHGLQGAFKIDPFTHHDETFAVGRQLWIDGVPRKIERLRWQRNCPYVNIEGIDKREQVAELRGHILTVPESELAPLEEGEYYSYQIVGLEVFEESGERLGKIEELLSSAPNDVYVVRGPRGEILIPAIEDVVIEIDVEAGRMVVSLMDGMLPAGPGPAPDSKPS